MDGTKELAGYVGPPNGVVAMEGFVGNVGVNTGASCNSFERVAMSDKIGEAGRYEMVAKDGEGETSADVDFEGVDEGDCSKEAPLPLNGSVGV